MARMSTETMDPLRGFKNCEKCEAPFSDLYIGGVGDWRTTIMCQRCFHIRDGVPRETIYALVAAQYDLTVDEARRRDEASQAEYEKMVAEASDFG